MKTYLRKASERGYFEIDWLKSYHSFSFGEYYDPGFMGYYQLRVINHDSIKQGAGFPMHGHKDMEIITYVLNGTVEHEDSIGNKAQTVAGDVQVMTAGRGIRHSEYNPSSDHELELLQIWLLPSEKNLTPGYRQMNFSREQKLNKILLVASPEGEGEGESMVISAKARLFAGVVTSEQKLEHSASLQKAYWVQVANGHLEVNGIKMDTGDGLALEGIETLELSSPSEGEFLLFELN